MAGGGRGLWHSGSGPVPPLHHQTGGDSGAGASARLSRHGRGPDDPLRRARAPEQPPPPHQAAGPSCSALVFFLSPVRFLRRDEPPSSISFVWPPQLDGPYLAQSARSILCKHALKVLTANNVFILPPQYIMGRWTKYAKRGFYVYKQESGRKSNKTWAARISRMATSIALKCSVSKELHDLEKGMQKLDLEADVSLSKLKDKSDEVSLVDRLCNRPIERQNIV
ncbi:uncharacterized protein [Miscanthus floridulus]|uniref:uncharacterized protein n=1 Tax=Miscanthus floridulus TaxID=154761 RepID=UPI003459E35D